MNEKMSEIVGKIKEKKELSGIADSLVEKSLSDYLKKMDCDLERCSNALIKQIVKDVRAELRLLTGRFQRNYALSGENNANILERHTSTAERTKKEYGIINSVIEKFKVRSILDLGCGVDPIAIARKGREYYAADINEKELKIIEEYFEKNKISGKTFVFDLRDINNDYGMLPSADLGIILKVLDIVDKKGHKNAEEIIRKIKCKLILASFSKIKLSGRKMNNPKRIWMNHILNRLGYKYEIIEGDNEFFYLIFKEEA